MIPQGFVLVLAATFVVAKVDAVAPPHPNYTNWESVYALRRRLNITFNYQPSHISDEHCRHLSEEQCRTDDEAAAGAKAQRVLASSTPASGFTHGNHLKVLVLLCRFSDHANRQLPTRAYYDELFNGAGLSAVNPVGSIRQWMYFNSVGKYNGMFF